MISGTANREAASVIAEKRIHEIEYVPVWSRIKPNNQGPRIFPIPLVKLRKPIAVPTYLKGNKSASIEDVKAKPMEPK